MSDSYVGEIRMFAGNFAPRGWLFCQGQTVSISDYGTLFNLIGTTYGGDGQNTFALPNLTSRVPIHIGTQQGNTYPLAATGGSEQVTVTTPQLPPHTHPLAVASGPGTTGTPSSSTTLSDMGPAGTTAPPIYGAYDATSTVTLNGQSIGSTGSNQSHSNIQPYLAVNFIISMSGQYPSQS